MDFMQAIENRHSVRDYTDKKIDKDIVLELQKEIDRCNDEGGCTYSWLPTNRKPLAASWPTTVNLTMSKTISLS